MITTAVDATSIWKLIKDGAKLVVTIPATESTEANITPISCINNSGSIAAVYRGNLSLTIYNISNGSSSVKETRNSTQELRSNDPNFNYK